MPDLILVDGGKGQLHAAEEVLLSLGLSIPIAGLKKNSQHTLEALVYHDQIIPLLKQSELYKFLLKLSEEVHRFAITFHRETRKKKAKESILDDIEGLGEKRKKLLLSHFTSLDEIKQASIEEIEKCGIPEAVAKRLKEELQ
jgi:excinuclease ABC subunit C